MIKTLKDVLQNVEDEPGKKQKSQDPTVCVAENSQAESLYNAEQEIANYRLCTPERQNTLHVRYRSPEQQEKEEEEEDTLYETSVFNPFFEKPSVNEDNFKENKKKNMWKLETSGRVVEEELYNLGHGLEFEHGAHSFIVDMDDELIKQHFSEAERLEMENECVLEIPQLSQVIIDYLIKFNDKEICKAINEPDERFDMKYDQDAYHELDYIRFALYALVREIENGGLKGQNLEAWYNCHVWNVIVDQAKRVILENKFLSDKHVKQTWWDYLRSLWKILKTFEKNYQKDANDRRLTRRRGRGLHLFTILPHSKFQKKFILIDSTALYNLLSITNYCGSGKISLNDFNENLEHCGEWHLI
nr:7649_t:CDS:2 [Entrophospora candida]